jgi:hypothetical protein
MHVRNYAVALYLVPRQAPAGRALRRLTDRFSLFGCGERKRAVIDLFARDFRLLTGEGTKIGQCVRRRVRPPVCIPLKRWISASKRFERRQRWRNLKASRG